MPIAGGRTRVLIVEDDALQAQILEAALTARGYETEIVSDGITAVWQVRSGRYDAVLVDFNLPEIDGLATAHLVNDFLGSQARPVMIALTATPERLTAQGGGAALAFDGVVEKSCDLTPLLSCMTRALAAAPNVPARRTAEASLLLEEWSRFDEPAAVSGGDNPAPPRILVVEDDDSQRALLTSLLEQRGYRVEAIEDGLSAVRRMRDREYDLAVLDYGLPVFDGLAAGRVIHEMMGEDTRPRLIALTATPAQVQERQVGADRVFDAVLGKSADPSVLLREVDRVLRGAPNPRTRHAAAAVHPVDSAA